MTEKQRMRKPSWLKVRIEDPKKLRNVSKLLSSANLNTVCEAANCPNRLECYGRKTATFMILGRTCTRNCTFCNVTGGAPDLLDPDEPMRVASAVRELGLRHAVITSVTRDDLEDGGSGQFASVIRSIRRKSPGVTVEVLIPDFQGSEAALHIVMDQKPDILNHNVETVPRLYDRVRPEAKYSQSLELIQRASEAGLVTKSGFMLGLGEKDEEVEALLKDLRAHGCDLVTIGQYLPPSKDHIPVEAYVTPEKFDHWGRVAKELGFKDVASGPLVRSSYMADEMMKDEAEA